MTLSRKVRSTPFSFADSYKLSHPDQYDQKTQLVYSNFTPRKPFSGEGTHITFFGLQAALLKINDKFQKDFFDLDEETAVNEFRTFHKRFLGIDNEKFCERVRYIHQLGYLPIKVKALPEGASVPYGVPVFVIFNTDPHCFWLTNALESWLSCEVWDTITAATTAKKYRATFDYFANLTSDQGFMPAFQGHDFSIRGLPGMEAAKMIGASHALFFQGSDNCMVLEYTDQYYPGSDPEQLLVTSVPATEHAVASANGNDKAFLTELLTWTYPKGILSYVSDTWDFWKVVTETLPELKELIMSRDGKLVVRPDSSPKTPYEIICGDMEAPVGSPEYLGLIRCLWNTFGGEVNSKGYKQLDSHIGAIYGEAITPTLQIKILKELMNLGFSSTNIVFGIGSYTYQYVTRDTHGLAMKATEVCVNGEWKAIFKSPKTDSGTKKSAKGLLKVIKNEAGEYVSLQEQKDLDGGELVTVYSNGNITLKSFQEVRRVAGSIV